MERLTNKREADAQREEYERRLANGYPRNIPEARFLRLAAYEDTGLTPEEIKAPFTEDTMINLAAQALGVEPSRLRELAEADKEGRVVVLPCKVGETVYFARANPILQYKVTGYEMGEASISQVRSKHVDKETGLTFNFTFRPGSIGKTVFLSREEAEKALEEREGKKDGNETNM